MEVPSRLWYTLLKSARTVKRCASWTLATSAKWFHRSMDRTSVYETENVSSTLTGITNLENEVSVGDTLVLKTSGT